MGECVRQRAHIIGRDVTGALLLILAWLFFTIEMVCVRLLSDDLAIAQIASIRTGMQALLMTGLVGVLGVQLVKTQRFGMHVFRALCSQSGMVLFYLAFALLPLALATTLTFMQASFITIFAALFLGEAIGWRRVAAVAVGFLGVLVVMRPGLGGFQPAMLVALAGAAVTAALITVTRSLSTTDGRWTIMFWSAWLGLAMIAVPAATLWQPVAAEHLPLLAVLGLAGTTGQFLMVGAFQLAEASVLAPVDYVRLVFAVLAGWLIFSELPDVWTWVGSAIILASAATIAVRRPRQFTER